MLAVQQTGKGLSLILFYNCFVVQVRRQSLAGMTLRLQLPQPACLQPECSRSPSRLHKQEHRDRARDRARVSKHRTRPSSTPLCPLAMDTLVRKSKIVFNEDVAQVYLQLGHPCTYPFAFTPNANSRFSYHPPFCCFWLIV